MNNKLLKEILNMIALPFNWLDDERAIFNNGDVKYGIVVEYLTLNLGRLLDYC